MSAGDGARALPLVVRFADSSGIDVEGDPRDLRLLAEALVAESEGVVLRFDRTGTDDPAPYDRFLEGLRVVAREHKVRIACPDELMIVEGSEVARRMLTRSILWFADSPRSGGSVSDHIHIEFHDGHFYLEPDSEPLVVTKRPADDR